VVEGEGTRVEKGMGDFINGTELMIDLVGSPSSNDKLSGLMNATSRRGAAGTQCSVVRQKPYLAPRPEVVRAPQGWHDDETVPRQINPWEEVGVEQKGPR